MSLPNQAVRDLKALINLQTDGVVLQGHFEQGLSSMKEGSVDGFCFLSELNGVSILSASHHEGQVDSKVANIFGNSSLKGSTGCQPRPRHPHDSGKREKADAGSESTPRI